MNKQHTSESTQIVTKFIPILVNNCNVPIKNIKTDCTTSKTESKRVDIIISSSKNYNSSFENDIITIIEAKKENAKALNIYNNKKVKKEIINLINKNIDLYGKGEALDYGNISEKDWFNALIQGKWKSEKLNIPYFGVTNIKQTIFYNTYNLEPILIKKNIKEVNKKGKIKNKVITEKLNDLPTYELMKDLKDKINENNNICDYTTLSDEDNQIKNSMTEKEFINFLEKIHNDFYKKQLEGSKEFLGDIILTFIFFKYLEERINIQSKQIEYKKRSINLWSEWIDYDSDEDKGRKIYNIITTELKSLKHNEQADKKNGDYIEGYETEYRDFCEILVKEEQIQNNTKVREFLVAIYEGLNGKSTGKPLYLHQCEFDIYGAIYEKFKNPSQKKELGQFYTKRHISKILANLSLRPFIDDIDDKILEMTKKAIKKGKKLKYKDIEDIIYNTYKEIKILDPSCGTGGLLTEAYSYLSNEYRNRLKNKSKKVEGLLKSEIFTGIDKQKECVEKTKLNMFFAGDGHTDIFYGSSIEKINGQTIELEDDCKKNKWNVILSNPPYGQGQEYTFIKKYINSLVYEGRIGLIIPNGVLENPSSFYNSFREFIIKNIRIESIISVPKFAFSPYALQKTYILIGYKRDETSINPLPVSVDEEMNDIELNLEDIAEEINDAELNIEDIVEEINDIKLGLENIEIEGSICGEVFQETNYENSLDIEELDEDIWVYIMDYDGFNLSKDRWETNLISYDSKGRPFFLHNDISELIEKYLKGDDEKGNIKKVNQIHIDGSVIGEKSNSKEDEYILIKSKYLKLNKDITKINKWNILPEYHVRPYKSEFITIEDLKQCVKEIESEIESVLQELVGVTC